MRHCKACGRPLVEADPDGHELLGQIAVQDSKGVMRKVRQWRCRVRLVAYRTGRVLGRKGEQLERVSTYVPDSPQRTKQNQTAFVPLAVLKARGDV